MLRAAQREVRSRWVRQLKARGDLRAVAVAAFLDEAFFNLPKEDPGSRARLQDFARRSTDPLLTSLALQRPCAPHECRNIEATQWSRLEPDNILAWLAQLDPASLTWQRKAELVAQIAAQGRHSESHLREVVAMLIDLPHEREPGLAFHAEALLLHEFHAGGGPDPLSVVLICRSADAPPGMREDCLRIAERLWEQGSFYDRWLGLALGRILDPGSPQWTGRRVLHDAVRRAHEDWQRQEMQALAAVPTRDQCASLPQLRDWEIRRLSTDEWQQGLALVNGSGLTPRAWLARWHEAHPQATRPDYLDPAPPASR